MAGDERRCVGIVILADSMAEEDETFDVVIEELGISTTVTILDDGTYFKIHTMIMLFMHCIIRPLDTPLSYIGDSPMVIGNTVAFDLSLGSHVMSASCALLIGNRVQSETDCE